MDSRSIATADGDVSFDFLVMGDPCSSPGRIPREAPDVNCVDGKLDCSLASDEGFKPCMKSAHGKVIVGMLLPDQGPATEAAEMLEPQTDRGATESFCEMRAASGTHSGMGTIFIEVAQINPI